jgi:hypothetical protein
MQLVSPLIQYMKDEGFIRDTCDPVCYSVTTAQINFSVSWYRVANRYRIEQALLLSAL